MCNIGIPHGKGRDARVDDEASRHDIGWGTEPKHWDAYLFRREPKIAPCGTRPKLELSNSPASAVRYRVQGVEAKRLQSRCRYWMDAGERKLR